MAWIKTIPFEESDEQLKDILMITRMGYPQEYASPALHRLGIDESIIDSHTLIPDALYHAFSTFSALMYADLGPSIRSAVYFPANTENGATHNARNVYS